MANCAGWTRRNDGGAIPDSRQAAIQFLKPFQPNVDLGEWDAAKPGESIVDAGFVVRRIGDDSCL